jgi:hypothetical protein
VALLFARGRGKDFGEIREAVDLVDIVARREAGEINVRIGRIYCDRVIAGAAVEVVEAWKAPVT